LLPQVFDRYFQKVGYEFNLGFSNPDVALCRSGTASATPDALEMQTRDIPRRFVFIFGHLDIHCWAGTALNL